MSLCKVGINQRIVVSIIYEPRLKHWLMEGRPSSRLGRTPRSSIFKYTNSTEWAIPTSVQMGMNYKSVIY
jgi:hypothetical protein